jgi:hypothetical protein
MGRAARLLSSVPERKEERVTIEGEEYVFRCDAPGELIEYAFLDKDIETRALHFATVTGRKVSTETLRFVRIIQSTMQGERDSELDLVKLFLVRPQDFYALLGGAQAVIPINAEDMIPDGLKVPADVQVGAGNLQGAGASGTASSPESSTPQSTTPTGSNGRATRQTSSSKSRPSRTSKQSISKN